MPVAVSGKFFRNIERSFLADFREFHRDNPQVYEHFRQIAFRMRDGGFKRYSAWAIVSQMRWEHDIRTRARAGSRSSGFKLCNDFIALYARLLLTHEPALEGFLTLRPLKRVQAK